MPKNAIHDSTLTEKAKKIKLLILDVDGVLTDGKLYFDNEGNESKAFSTLDGQGIKQLRKSGVEVAIITGRKSALVARRADDLGIELLIQGREDKAVALDELLQTFPCELEHIAFLGDDWPDLSAMRRVGLAITVPNAHWQMHEYSDWTTQKQGGDGAVRDVCDLIMLAQDRYDAALSSYVGNNDK